MQKHSRSATLFVDKDSWIHRLHPFTKLSYIVLTGVLVYSGIISWKFTGFLLLGNVLILLSGDVLRETYQAVWRIMLPLLLFMVPIHSFLYPGNKSVLYSISVFVIYQEGFYFALVTLLKLTVVLMTSLLFVFSTHPADLISSISHTGKSPSLAYLFGSPLLLLAGMRERIEIIRAAQQARGLHTGGNIFRRFCSLAPLILPLVTGAIVEVEQRSIALEVRGFRSNSVQTTLRIVPDSTMQRLSRWLMVAGAVGIIIFRIIR